MKSLIPLLLLAPVLYAQLPVLPTPKAPESAAPAEQDPFGRDSPRGCVVGFLTAAEKGDYFRAAQYLDVHDSGRANDLAPQLQAVLNHGLIGNIDDLSRSPKGDLKDQLRVNRDRVGFVRTNFGQLEILVDRVQRSAGTPIWLFSSQTLQGVPRVFDELNTPGIEKFIPRPLRETKLFSLPLWRWSAIFAAIAVALLSASLLTRALVPLLRPLVRRITGHEEDRYLYPLKRPVSLILLAIALRVLAQFSISLLAHALWEHVSNALAIAGFAWLLIQFSDIVTDLRSRQLIRRQTTGHIAVLALTHRLFKIFVLFVAVVLLLHGAGVDVSAMLAGLGIGGIALALAAQKTLEDLFGGITIITRNALRVGDFCKLADETGTIEDIGLGSTRVRTLDRTVLTIPNAKVSQMNLENYSMREKIWFHHVFGLLYQTSPQQLRRVLGEITQMLRNDPRVESESARIRLLGFGASSLNLEIFAYVKERDFTLFLEIQEDLLLHVLDIVAASGTGVALPSQITYLDRAREKDTQAMHSVPEN